jgi:hypothetical protein
MRPGTIGSFRHSFQYHPAARHLCASRLSYRNEESVRLAHLTAKPRKVLFYDLGFNPIDSDQARSTIESRPMTVSTPKR